MAEAAVFCTEGRVIIRMRSALLWHFAIFSCQQSKMKTPEPLWFQAFSLFQIRSLLNLSDNKVG